MYLFASTMPFQVLTLACDAYSHTAAVERLRFCEIANVELYSLFAHICTLIGNTEVKPLVMTSCICVNSHKQIILIFACFYYHVKITRLKQGVELQIVMAYCRIHTSKLARLVRLWHSNTCCNGDVKFVRTYVFAACSDFFIGKVFVH